MPDLQDADFFGAIKFKFIFTRFFNHFHFYPAETGKARPLH